MFVDEYVVFDAINRLVKEPAATKFLDKTQVICTRALKFLGKGAAVIKNACLAHPGLATVVGVVGAVVVVGAIMYVVLKDKEDADEEDVELLVDERRQPALPDVSVFEFNTWSAYSQSAYVRTKFLPLFKPKVPSEVPDYDKIPLYLGGMGENHDDCIFLTCLQKAQIHNLPCGHMTSCLECDDSYIVFRFCAAVGGARPDYVLDANFFANWYHDAVHCAVCRTPVEQRVLRPQNA